MYTLSPETIKYADSLAVSKYGIPEITLMRTAAKFCFDYILPLISKGDRIVIVCGKGNNGGDGYELASLLKKAGFDTCAINVFDSVPNTETAKTVFNECEAVFPSFEWKNKICQADVIIDALFGVGFYGSIEEDSEIGKLILACNESNALKIAVDTPSGINSADGRVGGIVFRADHTITMAYAKTGMLSYPAREYCGKIAIADIGYPDELCNEIPKDALVADDGYVKSLIPERQSNTHKGCFGRLLMYCGSENMTGAGVLAANGALRTGCGLVNIANTKEVINKLQAHLTEPVFSVLEDDKYESQLIELCGKATAVLCGCGLGVSDIKKQHIISLIKNADCNIIFDADGINMLCGNTLILKEARKTPILTPHPLEFARLTETSTDTIQKDRINLAKEFSQKHGCVLVLKGASTVIASPDGRLAINTSGNPGLAKGGSGDVLAGIISSFCAQGLPAFESAVLGVYLHGKAADILKEEISEYGLLPSDLPMAVAKLLP